MSLPRIIFIVGPTAVGKTGVSLQLAQNIKGEIVSCDSMQVYREVSVITSKPPESSLKKIKHHLVNVVSVKDEFDAAAFRTMAVHAIEDIVRRDKVPIAVGGSGLYVRVLLDGIFPGPSRDEALRRNLQEEATRHHEGFLHEQLRVLDPDAAAKIHPRDLRRIIRALEVRITTNRPISQLQKNRDGLWGKYDIMIYGLSRPRAELYAMVNERVEKMFEEGAVEEIDGLKALKLSRTALNIIGVREILGYLKGEYDVERAKYLVKLNTRRFAKRQLTWFRADRRIRWISPDPERYITDGVNKIMEDWSVG